MTGGEERMGASTALVEGEPFRLLAPLDGSEQSISALPYAMTLATPGGEVILLTVVPSSGDLPPIGGNEPVPAFLERAAGTLRSAGITVETRVLAGDPVAHIVEAAAHDGADLIVLASHGRGVLGRLLHGSVADKVARAATVPVMVVRSAQRQAGPASITRLVLPLDGSPLAEQSIPVATALALRLSTPLLLVRAVNMAELMPPAIGMGEAIPFQIYDETEEEMNKEASTYLDAKAEELRREGFTVSTKVLSGPAASAIGDVTQASDVVVLCSHERTGLARWLMGSVAEELVRDDDCPVILVPGHETSETA